VTKNVKKHILELKRFVEKCPEIRAWLRERGLLASLAKTETVEHSELGVLWISILLTGDYDCQVFRLCGGRVIVLHVWDITGIPWDLVILYDKKEREIEKRIIAWEPLS